MAPGKLTLWTSLVYVAVPSPECRQNHDTKIANILFENVSQFKYFGMTITNKNLIQAKVRD
jgi:hypothetical protein